MSLEYTSAGLNSLNETLEATGVVSDSFRRLLLGYAQQAHQDGFKAGKESADPSYGLTPTVDPDSGLTQETPAFKPSIPPSQITTTEPTVILDVLRDSIDDEGNVRIDYVDRYGERTLDREVGPVELVDGDRGVICLDVEKDAFRRFNVDSIRLLSTAGC